MYPRGQYRVQSCSFSLLIWMIRPSIVYRPSLQRAQPTVKQLMQQSCDTTQTDPDRLDKWVDGNLIKFNMGKCKVLHIGSNNLLCQWKGPMGPRGSQINLMPNNVPLPQRGKKYPGLHCEKCYSVISKLREVILPIFSGLLKWQFGVLVPSARQIWRYSKVQQRATMIKLLEHLSWEVTLGDMVSLEQKSLRQKSLNPLKGGCKKDEARLFPVTRPGGMCTRWNIKTSLLNHRRNFPQRDWLTTGTCCPGKLWRIHPWRYSKDTWMLSWNMIPGWLFLSRGVGQDDLQRPLPASVVRWFHWTRLNTSYHHHINISSLNGWTAKN